MSPISQLPNDHFHNTALVQRLFDITGNPATDINELTQLDAIVYGRMAEHYGLDLADALRLAA